MLGIGFGRKDVRILPCVEGVRATLRFEGHSLSGPSFPKHYWKRLVTWPRWQEKARATARETGTEQQLKAAKKEAINQSRTKQTKETPALGSEGCRDSRALAMWPEGELGWSRAAVGQDGGASGEPWASGGEHWEGHRVRRLWLRCAVRAVCTPGCFPGMEQQGVEMHWCREEIKQSLTLRKQNKFPFSSWMP